MCTTNNIPISNTDMEERKLWFENILKEKSQENCISKILHFEIKPATMKGDNYSGCLERVVLEILLKSGKKVKKSLIAKFVPKSEYRKDKTEKVGVFEKEIAVYRDILPSMEDTMQEFGDHTEFMWPNCVHLTEYSELVFNDLIEDGYVMKDRKQGLDLQHCLIVMRSIAKFHAISLILKERGLMSMETFKQSIFHNKHCYEMNVEFLPDSFLRLADAAEKWGPEWKPIAEKIRTEITPNIMTLLMDQLEPDDNKFNVLCHGDCWINNMLFKYGLDDETPISVKFVDFQLTFYNSPAYDLTYFLILSPNREVRENSIQYLIKTYHETLGKQLEFYSYKGPVISFDELLNEMKRVTWFRIMTAINILPIVLMENPEQMPDLEQINKQVTEDKKLVIKAWVDHFKLTPFCNEILKHTLTEAINNNIL